MGKERMREGVGVLGRGVGGIRGRDAGKRKKERRKRRRGIRSGE